MRDAHGAQQVSTEDLFDQIGRFLRKHRLRPDPSHYAFAHAVLSAPDGPLAAQVAQLTEGGVRLLLYQGAMVHAKTATIDGQWSTIGTANIDRISLLGNYELNIEVFSPDVARQLEEIFAIDSSNTAEMTETEWKSRHAMVKFSETVLAPLRPLL